MSNHKGTLIFFVGTKVRESPNAAQSDSWRLIIFVSVVTLSGSACSGALEKNKKSKDNGRGPSLSADSDNLISANEDCASRTANLASGFQESPMPAAPDNTFPNGALFTGRVDYSENSNGGVPELDIAFSGKDTKASFSFKIKQVFDEQSGVETDKDFPLRTVASFTQDGEPSTAQIIATDDKRGVGIALNGTISYLGFRKDGGFADADRCFQPYLGTLEAEISAKATYQYPKDPLGNLSMRFKVPILNHDKLGNP